MDDKRAIACNHAEGNKVLPKGALCYVIMTEGMNERLMLLARSRGGRWVEVWQPIKHLTNFRFKTIPPQHPRYNDSRLADYFTDETLERIRGAAEREHGQT